MLDPFTALSVVSAVVQFVEYGTDLVSKAYDVYSSVDGTIRGQDHVRAMTARFSELSEQAAASPPARDSTSTRNEKALKSLASSCKLVADDLLQTLKELEIEGSKTVFKSMKVAYKAQRRKEKIQKHQKKLEGLRQELNIQLVVLLSDRQSKVLGVLNTLGERNRHMETNLTTKLDQLKKNVLTAADSGRAPKGRLLDELQSEAKDVALQQRILRSFRFEYMTARHNQIKPTHSSTYEWIFKDTDPYFQKWLETGEGTYWISGKAGSGKSTLMKFISSHEQTRAGLERWAGSESKLVIASHYFWASSETKMQRSQDGLLQTLLYDVFRQCPGLIAECCPERWQSHEWYTDTVEPWSRAQLDTVFARLTGKQLVSQGRPVKFCFFVDGLDEYKGGERRGDENQIVDILRKLFSDSITIKMCVASRPWNAFERVFGENANPDRTFRLDRYTKPDIKAFVKDRLEADERFKGMQMHVGPLHELTLELTEKAQGVFLWVTLVVSELLRGLENADSVSKLRKRLEELPSDLEEYFQRIFDDIETFYRQQTAQIFMTCVRARAIVPVLAFTVFENNTTESVLQAPIDPMDDGSYLRQVSLLRRQLNGSCKDLLEVIELGAGAETSSSPKVDHNIFHGVDFLHRTVKDFLIRPHMSEMLSKEAGRDFNPLKTLCNGYILFLKRQPYKTDIAEHYLSFMFYARGVEIESDRQTTEFELLTELDRVLTARVRSKSHWINEVPSAGDDTHDVRMEYGEKSFLSVAVELDLQVYVSKILAKNPSVATTKRGRPLIDYALRSRYWQSFHGIPSTAMVQLLIDSGASPSTPISVYDGRTPWDLFLRFLWTEREHRRHDSPQEMYEVTKLLIAQKVDPNLKSQVSEEKSQTAKYQRSVVQPVYATPQKVFDSVFDAEDAARLQQLLGSKQSSGWWNWLSGK